MSERRPTSDGLPLYMTLDEIERQRAVGWCDWHPERYCQRCGGRNFCWHVASPLWNKATEAANAKSRIWCPRCFVAEYALATETNGGGWELRPSDDTRAIRERIADLEEENQRLRRFINEHAAQHEKAERATHEEQPNPPTRPMPSPLAAQSTGAAVLPAKDPD